MRRVPHRPLLLTLPLTLLLTTGVLGIESASSFTADNTETDGDVEQWVTLDGPGLSGRGNSFLNFDFNWDEDGADPEDHDGGPRNSRVWVDWPVTLIFVSKDPDVKVSTSEVKRIVANRFPEDGNPMHALLAGSKWDADDGAKQGKNGGCGAQDFSRTVHFRVYGPDGEGSLSHPEYGRFVIATSHIDYREGCKENKSTGNIGQSFGDSEKAEEEIAAAFREKGYPVQEDEINLGNAFPGHSDSNGRATVVHLDGRTL